MALASQTILSQLGVDFSDCADQTAVDARLAAYKQALQVKDAPIYKPPVSAFNPFDPSTVDKRQTALNSYLDAVKSGDIAAAHTAADAGAQVGGLIWIQSDLVILHNAPGEPGRMATLVLWYVQNDPTNRIIDPAAYEPLFNA